MKTKNLVIILIATICLGVAFDSSAQAPGIISGKVIDVDNSEALAFANVFVDSTNYGTTTDLDGNYEIILDQGTYTLTSSYLGYSDESQKVIVNSKETSFANFNLKYGNAIETEVVTITAQASGQVSAINQQINSNKIVNVVSAEKMEELPDANAAESIGRLPGVSLQRSSGEASKIVVRGLSPKYSNVTIGGVKMASTNSSDRSADLSLITGEMLAGIEVSKSLRADMDADAIGGTIDLRIREASEGLHFGGSAEGGYNDVGNSLNNYKFVSSVSNRFFKNKLGARLQISTEKKQLPSHRFGGNYSSPILFQTLDSEGNLTGESEFKLRTEGTVLTDQTAVRNRNGANLTLDYKLDFWKVKLFSLYNSKKDDGVARVNNYTFIRPNEPFSKSIRKYESNTELLTNSLENEFKFLKTELRLNLSYSYAQHDSPLQDFRFIELSDGSNPINQDYLLLRQPSEILNEFGQTNVESSFLQTMSLSEGTLVDQNYDIRLDWDIPFKINEKITGTFSLGGKYHLLERESDNVQDFVNFQFGAGRPRKEALIALVPSIETNLSAQRGISADNFIDADYDSGEFLNNRYELGWGADVEQLVDVQNQFIKENRNLYQKDGYSNFFQDYSNSEEIIAGYAMAEINIGKRLMILPGIRFENERTTYQGFQIEQVGSNSNGIRGMPDSVSTNRQNDFFFPSLNLKYRITDWLFTQGAVYRSTTRPDFNLLSPSVIITENTSDPFTSGNPFLKPSIALNYDLGVSLHSNKLGLFSVNLFYKKVDRFIFTLGKYFPQRRDLIVNGPDGLLDALPSDNLYPLDRLEQVHRTNIPFNNFEASEYRGIELSWQTNFWYLPSLWKGFVLDVNLTFLDSETRYPYFEDVVVGVDSSGFFPKDIIGYEYKTTPGRLVDQPKAIINVILGWDYKGFSSRISYRYQGSTLQNQDSRLSLSNSFYDKFSWFDFSAKQDITEHFSFFVNLTNISQHIDDYFINFGGRVDLPTSSEHYGFRGQFGVIFKY